MAVLLNREEEPVPSLPAVACWRRDLRGTTCVAAVSATKASLPADATVRRSPAESLAVGQALALTNRGQGLDGATPAGQFGLSLLPLGGPLLRRYRWPSPAAWPAWSPCSWGWRSGRARCSQHPPGDHGQLSRGGHHGHVAGLLFQQAAEEVAQRTGVLVEMLRGLDQHPAGLAVAAFGDGAVVAVLRRLLGGRHRPM